jgi:hypothetical protein
MFICEHCGCLSDKGEKPVRVVTETREKFYFRNLWDTEPMSKGWEIVKEILIHQDCKHAVLRSA